jgi:hypothetical protein
MSLGKILYKTYYQPKGAISKTLKQGIYSSWQISQGRKAMQTASAALQQPLDNQLPLENIPQFSFLTGKKFWYMTAFCAYSLARVCQQNIAFVFYDDGSFDAALEAQIKAQFPLSRTVGQQEIAERLHTALPEDRFPFLHYKRRVYPHIRKLTDVHAGSAGYKLLLDSDMLFWQEPDQMLKWLKQADKPFFILDKESAYHYSFNLMKALCGYKVTERVNVGAIGLQSESIDWEKLEHWAKAMEEKEGSSYLLEQALTAMLIAGQPCEVGAEKNYIVMPDKAQTFSQSGTLHHYVAASKEWYYREMWKHSL